MSAPVSAPVSELGLGREWVPVSERAWEQVSAPVSELSLERELGPVCLSDRRSPQRRRGGRQSVP